MTVAPPAARTRGHRARVVDLERDPDVAGDPPADLDLVDEVGLARIGDLERRPARLEDRDAAVGRRERGPFREPEDVAVEADGLLVVVVVTTSRISWTAPSSATGRGLAGQGPSSSSIVASDGPRSAWSRAATASAPRITRRTLPPATFRTSSSL